MLINLTDVFNSEGKFRSESIPFEADFFVLGDERYTIVNREDSKLVFENVESGKVLLSGDALITLKGSCDRCLRDVEFTVCTHFEHDLYSPDSIADGGDREEQSFLSGYDLDTEELLRGEFIINMPVKILCKEDCKGICKVCGQNLNEKECGCDTFVPDPRWAGLKDFFK